MQYIFGILEAHWLTQCRFCWWCLKSYLKLLQPSVGILGSYPLFGLDLDFKNQNFKQVLVLKTKWDHISKRKKVSKGNCKSKQNFLYFILQLKPYEIKETRHILDIFWMTGRTDLPTPWMDINSPNEIPKTSKQKPCLSIIISLSLSHICSLSYQHIKLQQNNN